MKMNFIVSSLVVITLTFMTAGSVSAQNDASGDAVEEGIVTSENTQPGAEIDSGDPSEESKYTLIIHIGSVAFVLALVAGLGVNVRKRLQVQQELDRSQQRLRAMLDASKDVAFITIDLSGGSSKILDFSSGAETLFGYSRNEVVGKPVAELYADEKAEDLDKTYEFHENQQHPLSTEPTLVRKSGQKFPAIMTTYAIHNEQGDAHTALALAVDMSDNRKTEDDQRRLLGHIQHAEKLAGLENLAGGVAHDFNNMLVGVIGNADLALMDLSPLSPARTSVEHIKTAAVKASELTRQLLAYAGKGHFVIELVNLNKLVKGISQLLRASVSKKIVLDYEFAEDLPPVEVDTSQIRQLLVSLITNASGAMTGESGRIAITTSERTASSDELVSIYLDDDLPEGNYVCLEVSDTGPGMDELTVEHIFDPFFTTKETGRGIGLAAVLGIVRGHKGAVNVDSEPGKGSTFRVLFPASDKELRTEEEITGKRGPDSGEVSETVLIVDDEETVRRVGSTMLSRHGYTVLTASDGRKGVDIFRENADQIDVVLLNMTMPELNGPETYEIMRKIDPEVKVILCTGFEEEDTKKSFANHGLAGFIQKPFEMDLLLSKLEEVLSV